MMDYVTIESFFSNIKSKYRECALRIEDSKIYFEDNFRRIKLEKFLGVSLYFWSLVCFAFDPKKLSVSRNAIIRAIGHYVFIIILVFSCFWLLSFLLKPFVKVYNVIDYKNGCLTIELWLMGVRLMTLDKFENKDFCLIMNNVIPVSYNPSGSRINNVKGVPLVIDKRTDLYFLNEVLLLHQNGKFIHLWLGYSVESYSNCIELVDFISNMWKIRKLTCESNSRFEINYNNKFYIDKKTITFADGDNYDTLFVIALIVAFIIVFLLK